MLGGIRRGPRNYCSERPLRHLGGHLILRGARIRPVLGHTIAHYTLREKIGAGGMGEVYRATDSKLNRDVAIKVIPEEFARDPERMARFEREAQVLASLTHGGIAAVYGIEESGGQRALVMELVEGEDLSVRLKRG